MGESLNLLMVLIPALPLAAAVLTALLGPKVLRQSSHVPTILAIFGSFMCSAMLLLEVNRNSAVMEKPMTMAVSTSDCGTGSE